MRTVVILAIIATAVILNYTYLLLPEGRFWQPYLTSDRVISLQSWYEYITSKVLMGVLATIIYKLKPSRYTAAVMVSFWLFAVDYLVSYNDPYLYVSGYGITVYKPEGFYFPVSYPMMWCIALLSMISWIDWQKK